MTNQQPQTIAHSIEHEWATHPRWQGIRRNYAADDMIKLRPSLPVEHTLAKHGAEFFFRQLQEERYVPALGALTGAQAVQMIKAGLKAIYVSGWQVAADANLSGHTYPDQSLYPSNSVPALVKRINNALQRADLIEKLEGRSSVADWYAPIVADAEAGFGGPLHSFELMKSMIEAGAAAVHFEDQLAAEKKCGHLGGKVLVPTSHFIRNLTAARLAADVLGVPAFIIARTDALSATLLTSDADDADSETLDSHARTAEGYFRIRPGIESATRRALAYAPYADLLWFETSTPDIGEARAFSSAIHAQYPKKCLAYNCSPSFNWEMKLTSKQISEFQSNLADIGYKFQFITLAGWHSLNYHMFDLAAAYKTAGMPAFVALQSREIARENDGYTATRHQREVGTGYFDQVLMTVSGGAAATGAYEGSTEAQQFTQEKQPILSRIQSSSIHR